MHTVEYDKNQIGEIKALWQDLNRLHGQRSVNFRHHFSTFTFEERSEQLLSKEELKLFVAYEKGQKIGYCAATLENGVGEIDSIYIKPNFQSAGVGRELMERALDWLEHFHCKSIRVAIAEGNESVMPFYERYGFKTRFVVLQRD